MIGVISRFAKVWILRSKQVVRKQNDDVGFEAPDLLLYPAVVVHAAWPLVIERERRAFKYMIANQIYVLGIKIGLESLVKTKSVRIPQEHHLCRSREHDLVAICKSFWIEFFT